MKTVLYIHVLLYNHEAEANIQCLPCPQCVLQWLSLHSGRPDEEASKIQCSNLISNSWTTNTGNRNLPQGGGTPWNF